MHLVGIQDQGIAPPETDLARDGACGGSVIAGHHDHVDAGSCADLQGLRDALADRVLEAEQAGEPEIAVRLTAGPARPVQFTPRAGDHLVPAPRELVDARLPGLPLLGRRGCTARARSQAHL